MLGRWYRHFQMTESSFFVCCFLVCGSIRAIRKQTHTYVLYTLAHTHTRARTDTLICTARAQA